MKQDEKMIASKIKAEAQRLGFFACGIAKAAPVEENVAEAYRKWLENGEEASMAYMTNYLEKRLNPALLVPGVRSIVSLAMNYAPAQQLPEGEYQLAAYALGQDYHDLMKQRLRELAVNIGAPMELFQKGKKPQSADEKEEIGWGIFCDTAPVLERYWAQKAGLGWVGRNHQLIIPHAGSMFFLGEVFLPLLLTSMIRPCRVVVAVVTDALMRVLHMPSSLMRTFMPTVACLISSLRTVANCRMRRKQPWATPYMAVTDARRHALGTVSQRPIRSQPYNRNRSFSA